MTQNNNESADPEVTNPQRPSQGATVQVLVLDQFHSGLHAHNTVQVQDGPASCNFNPKSIALKHLVITGLDTNVPF